MSQYIAVGACGPGQVQRKGGRCVSAKTAAASAALVSTATAPQEGFLSQYKWYLLGAVAAVGGAIYLKRRRGKGKR